MYGPAQGKIFNVTAPDNEVMLLDFGGACFALFDGSYSVRTPPKHELEIHGEHGSLFVGGFGGKASVVLQMREQEAEARSRNFEEVPLGFTSEEARTEALRCLQCKKPSCVRGCPVEVKIPEFIQLIADGEYAAAARKIKETNSLPAVCGRVCPQEEQCERACVLAA